MKFASIRDFRINASDVFQQLESEQQEIVVTRRGKPVAVLIGIEEDQLENVLKAVRRTRFTNVLQRSWAQATHNKTDQLTEAEINAEIRQARKTKRRP